MDLATNFIFLVIFGVIGFITEKIWGFDPYKWYSDLGAVILSSGIFLLILPIVLNPTDVSGNTNRVVLWFTNVLPGTLIGDVAGSFISAITGGGK